jgi:CRISPR/Cas system CSM-associated protein Csm2 small subunit
MSRQITQNYRGNNPPQRRDDEAGWRENIKSSLGENYVTRILNFEKLDLDEFKEFNNKLKEFIRTKSDNIGTTKMRKIYEVIKTAKDQRALFTSLPILAYMVGKELNRGERDKVGRIVTLLSDCIYAMKTEEDFKGIQKFAEALVAYHRYFNPRSE